VERGNMEYLRLARDLFERRKAPIEYPCSVLSVKLNSKDDLDKELKENWLLLTYRSQFKTPLPRSSLTSDKGWGCLIRTCQMMLAKVLRVHCGSTSATYFRDIDDPSAPFSIHNFVRAVSSQSHSFEPSFWSPSQGCEALRTTVANAVTRGCIKPSLTVFIARGGTISNAEVSFRLEQLGSVLLLVPVRSGIGRNITQTAFMTIELLLKAPQCVGIVGGVPKRSYYIIGTCGQRIKQVTGVHGAAVYQIRFTGSG